MAWSTGTLMEAADWPGATSGPGFPAEEGAARVVHRHGRVGVDGAGDQAGTDQRQPEETDSGEQATRVAKDLGMSCATLYGAHS